MEHLGNEQDILQDIEASNYNFNVFQFCFMHLFENKWLCVNVVCLYGYDMLFELHFDDKSIMLLCVYGANFFKM